MIENMNRWIKSKWVKLALCLFLCFFVENTAAWFTQTSVKTWYVDLQKPFWTPPAWVFPPVWTTLYFMMALALWIMWLIGPSYQTTPLPYDLFYTQLGINFLWSWGFFYMQSPLIGLVLITALIMMIITTMIAFWKYAETATCLLAPYLIWVCFASTINGAILWTNFS